MSETRIARQQAIPVYLSNKVKGWSKAHSPCLVLTQDHVALITRLTPDPNFFTGHPAQPPYPSLSAGHKSLNLCIFLHRESSDERGTRFLRCSAGLEKIKVRTRFLGSCTLQLVALVLVRACLLAGRCEGKCRPPSAARCPLGSCTFPPPCARLPPSSVLRAEEPAIQVQPTYTVLWAGNLRVAGT